MGLFQRTLNVACTVKSGVLLSPAAALKTAWPLTERSTSSAVQTVELSLASASADGRISTSETTRHLTYEARAVKGASGGLMRGTG
jgi:hypothetical protein